MSQGGHLSVSSSPAVATSYTTDSGSAVPVANVLQILANDTTSNNTNGVQTTGATNIVTVQLTNRLQGTGTATGAVPEDIITFDLGASPAVYRFEFDVAGRNTGTGDGVGYSVDATARTDGASATIIQTPNIDADEDILLVAALIIVVASGNNIILRVTGVVNQVIDYSAVGLYVVV